MEKDNSRHAHEDQMKAKVNMILSIVGKQAVHPNEIKSIVNEQILPTLAYGMQTTFYSRSFLEWVDKKIKRIVKDVMGAPRDGGVAFIYSNCRTDLGLGVRNLTEYQSVIGVKEALLRLTAQNLEGQVARSTLKTHQRLTCPYSLPLEQEALEAINEVNIKNGGHYWGQVQLALKDLNAQLKTQDVSAVWTDLTPGKKVDELMRMLGGEYEKVWSEIRPGLVEKGMPLTWDALTRKEGDCTGLKCWETVMDLSRLKSCSDVPGLGIPQVDPIDVRRSAKPS